MGNKKIKKGVAKEENLWYFNDDEEIVKKKNNGVLKYLFEDAFLFSDNNVSMSS